MGKDHNRMVALRIIALNQEKALVGAFSVIVETSRTFFSSSTEKGQICVSSAMNAPGGGVISVTRSAD